MSFSENGHHRSARQSADLYEAWLEHWFLKHADDPRGKVDEVWKQAEGLAWALHSQGITHVLVGKRGRHQWFHPRAALRWTIR